MSRNIKNENNDNLDYDNGTSTFTLTDDDGNDFEFELLDFVDYKDKLYAVLLPMENENAEDDMGIVIMETIFENNEPVFTFVDDEELAQNVLNEYASRVDEHDNDEEEQ